MTAVRVAARFWPRDPLDALVCTLFAGGFIFAFNVLPAAAIYGVLRLLRMSPHVSILGAVAFYLFIVVLLTLPTVRRLEVGPDGLRFVRLAGSPRALAWSEVSEIVAVSRKEVLFHAWLSWPPGEATTCLSSMGHYRIRFTGGVAYYPPKDAAEFEAVVREYRGDRRTRG